MNKILIRRGRPPRGHFDHLRTKIWVGAITYAARRRGIDLAQMFAGDRGWLKAWGRYKKGIINPSKQRVEEMAELFPGTDRYFFTALWDILENREYSNRELHRTASRLPPLIRRAFASSDDAFSGTFWATRSKPQRLMLEAHSRLDDEKLAIDFFSALVLSLRLAERAQDSNSYLCAMKCISAARHQLDRHPVLFALPRWLYRDLVEPLRKVRFAHEGDNDIWVITRSKYLAYSRERIDSFNVLQALDSYAHVLNEVDYENE